MSTSSFPYSYWAKVLGMLVIAAGVISFFVQHHKKGFFDFNELPVGLSWGLFFIFFSKEKADDEMMQGLKFKALARSIIIVFSLTHLFNYLYLNWYAHQDGDRILSVSAYQFVALTLIVATAFFYFSKRQVSQQADR